MCDRAALWLTMRPHLMLAAVIALIVASCGGDAEVETPEEPTSLAPVSAGRAPLEGAAAASQTGYVFPPAPSVPDGPLEDALVADLDTLFGSLQSGFGIEVLERIGASEDARVAWLLADMLRFFGFGAESAGAVDAFEALTGVDIAADPLSARSPWQSVTNHLIAWDIPAPPGYLDWKRVPFEIIEPKWSPFFDDEDAAIDWRVLSWGGVLIDDRPSVTPSLARGDAYRRSTTRPSRLPARATGTPTRTSCSVWS